jgi:DNA-binding transcriptional LysR family regulator
LSSTLSARLANLKARLGAPLLIRTTRSLRLTDEGQAYFESARRALAALRDAEAVVHAAKAAPSGVLRVSVPTSLAAEICEHVVVPYLRAYECVSVQLDASMRRVELAKEGFHLAIRIGPLDDSDLVARRLGVTTCGYYASPRYLRARGTPSTPKDLLKHDLVSHAAPSAWRSARASARHRER